MSTRMMINTGTVAGYNNKIMQATPDIKLGINNDVNRETKKVGLGLIDGGPSKINPPNSHPSNPIHKAVISRKRMRPLLPPPPRHRIQHQPPSSHDINKKLIVVGALLLTGLLHGLEAADSKISELLT